MRLADRLRRATSAWTLGAAIVLQWLSTLVVAALPERGGGWTLDGSPDAFGSILGSFRLVDGELPREGAGLLMPILLSPVASVVGDADSLRTAAVTLNVAVLGPLALIATYWIAARLGGRLFGLWTLALWLLGPWLLFLLSLDAYDPVVRERVLPLALGLTAEPVYPAAVALVLAAALVSGSLDGPSPVVAALAGVLAGAAVLVEPTSLLFVAAGAAAYVTARRLPEAGLFTLALVPAVLALLLWETRALDTPDQLAFAPIDWGAFTTNMAGLREYFWSQRLLQWLPLAGTFAVARRSVPHAFLLGGWLLAFGIVLGSQPAAGLEGAGLFRVLLPALPAYVLLAAAIPLLAPTLAVRLGAWLEPLAPGRRPGRRTLAVAAVVLAVVPLATASLGS